MSDTACPRVFTIPSGVSFLDVLADGIVARLGDDPAALTRAMILLPTRRSCRAMREAFLRRSGGRPALLPQLRPIGDVDDDELALIDDTSLDLPPAITTLRRRLVLARTILKLHGAESEITPPQAVELASELARLLDQIQTEKLGFEGLERLAPEELAQHWRRTVGFLSIVGQHWPAILAGEGATDPVERRNHTLAALARHWERRPPADPVVAAGSTGSIPATADLLKVISRLPEGAVVLPGLDRDLDDESWEALDESHPQYSLKNLIERLEITRDAVADWRHGTVAPPIASRHRLISAALRPAETTGSWQALETITPEAVDGLVRLDGAHIQEEAQLIALVLREALETTGRTAALITPDRELARRVAVELKRFDITADDTGGQPLAATPTLVFLRLVAEAFATGTPPAPLLAVLKHPLAAAGLLPAEFRRRARVLERLALRGPRPAPGLQPLADALREKGAEALAAWVENLARAAQPFAELIAGEAPPAELLRAHVALAEIWASSDSERGASRLWAGEAGEMAAEFVAELVEGLRDFSHLHGAAYPAFLEGCLAGRVIRPSWGGHPRLHILGPLEARLLSFDVVVLGGLNEGTWPAEAVTDPWMSRPMRKDFGLPAPERRIGLAAHDFVQACGAPKVVLTRAERVEGAPTVPSRWLQRLDAVLRASPLKPLIETRNELTHWQARLDHTAPIEPPGPPAPRPPVAARPRQLSVTEIETWLREPYAIYAKHVLGLRKIDPLDMDPGAADRGKYIHAVLAEFVDAYPAQLPADALERLLAIGRRHFAPALNRPSVWAFWWPRFETIARWFVAADAVRRADSRPLSTEGRGRWHLDLPGGRFHITGRADRIDRVSDGTLAIIDYKTGGKPSLAAVALGLAPQLPLEAAMAEAGGFKGVPAARVSQLRYWHMTGTNTPGSEISIDGGAVNRQPMPPVARLVAEAIAGLSSLIRRFDDPATPYMARPRPDYALRYNDYAHLARIKEWSATEDGT